MNALDYLRLLMTAKRNFYSTFPSDVEAQIIARIYDEVVGLINDIEKFTSYNPVPVSRPPTPPPKPQNPDDNLF